MNTNPNPIKNNYIQIIRKVKKLAFKSNKADAIRHQIEFLDKQAVELLSDSNAYYENRKLVWSLTDQLIKEAK